MLTYVCRKVMKLSREASEACRMSCKYAGRFILLYTYYMKIASGILKGMIAALLAVMPALAADANSERDYEIALTKGQYAIELQDFATAISHLTKALEIKPGDQPARVSLGIAYSRSGDYGRAREVLQQAVKDDPADSRAQYELALVLGKLGQTEESKRMMEAVAKSNDPELSAAAKGYLEGAAPGEKKRLNVKLSGGIQYDSNVILEPDAPTTPGVKNADWRAVLMLKGDYAFLQTGRADAEAGYAFYQSLHNDLSDYNVQQHTGKMAGRYALTQTVSAELEYDFHYTFVGGDHYSTAHWFGLRVPAKLMAESLTELHASYEAKRFFDTPVFTGLTGKNGSNTSAGLSHTIMLGKKSGISIDYTYDADAADADYWSYTGNKGTVNALADWKAYKFFGMLSYYDRKYDALAPGAPEKRHDGVQEYLIGISRNAGKRATVTLSDQYTINDSNLAVYQYTRNVISLMVEIRL